MTRGIILKKLSYSKLSLLVIVVLVLVATLIGCEYQPEPKEIKEVKIVGEAITKSTLTAEMVDPPNATVKYTWLISDAKLGEYAPIEGAINSPTYKVGQSDIGKFIKVRVTGIGNFKCTVESEPTDEIEDSILNLLNIFGLNEDDIVVDEINGTITILADFIINEDTTVEVPSGLTMIINEDVNVQIGGGKTLTVDGNLLLEGDRTIAESLIVKGDLISEGSLTVNKDLAVEGDLQLSGELEISGVGTIEGDLIFDGDGKISGNVTVENDLIVNDDLTINSGTTKVKGTVISDGEVVVKNGAKLDLTEGSLKANYTIIDGELLGFDAVDFSNGRTLTVTANTATIKLNGTDIRWYTLTNAKAVYSDKGSGVQLDFNEIQAVAKVVPTNVVTVNRK
jgi:cytoskeletal protein CcmA (bactofilin family)